MKRRALLFCSLVLVGASAWPLVQARTGAASAPAIAASDLLDHIRVLSSDRFEGRLPGTKGEDLSVTYIADQFRKAGVAPGNPDGTYFQKVPLVGITADPSATLVFGKGPTRQTLKFKDDFVAWTKRVTETARVVDSDMVFVGYGVQAPEFNWDDYKGVDLTGKTMVVLVGDPPVPSPTDAARLDPTVFGGDAMTYYGRWTYKYEMGAAKKAAAVLIIHETKEAGYPFSIVQGKVTEQFDLVTADKNRGRAVVEGWVTLDRAKALFALAGQDFDALKKRAATRSFTPVPLGVRASVTLHNTLRLVNSRNVVGKVAGGDPVLKNEWVVYTAHWDHFGIGPEINGDRIYHGAVDNASGVGGLIEVGRAFAQAAIKPKRSVLLISVTAEEQGLLGSDFYAHNPLYPLSKTLAVIDMDSLNVHGKTNDFCVIGLGQSELDDYASQAAAAQGRVIRPDPAPEQGMYYRSDHFPFAKQGVPALKAVGGEDYVGKPAGFGRAINDSFTRINYHKPSDTIRPDWDLAGAVQDVQVYYAVGSAVANATTRPEWKPASEFKARRDAMMSGK
jgi:Zn-dependent M28 family amino/carboxypeptidase